MKPDESKKPHDPPRRLTRQKRIGLLIVLGVASLSTAAVLVVPRLIGPKNWGVVEEGGVWLLAGPPFGIGSPDPASFRLGDSVLAQARDLLAARPDLGPQAADLVANAERDLDASGPQTMAQFSVEGLVPRPGGRLPGRK